MHDIQAMAMACASGSISEEEFIIVSSRLIKSYTNKWWMKIGKADGRDYDEKEQLCTIWCWESIRKYQESKGNFTTLYYRHCHNKVINLIKKRERQNERANNYEMCFSYELTIENEHNDETGVNSFYGQVHSMENGYSEIDIEMMLRKNGVDGIQLSVIKHKMCNPDMSCASIARILDCSRAYVSLLWNKSIPIILQELSLT